jgi:hypothetical protein
MCKQNVHPCDGLLQQWQMRREVANYYFNALLRLSPDDPNALQRHQELSRKIFEAQLSLKHMSDQLQSCEQEISLIR